MHGCYCKLYTCDVIEKKFNMTQYMYSKSHCILHRNNKLTDTNHGNYVMSKDFRLTYDENDLN